MTSAASIEGTSFAQQPLLVVEDNDDDALITRNALARAGVTNPIRVLADGEQAVAYLQGLGEFADRARYPLPILVLLDLNMPKRTGLEVLEWLRQQPGLKRLTVHILTASSRSADVSRAADLGANAYLIKPSKFEDLVTLFKAWYQLAHFAAFALPASPAQEG